MKKSVKGKALNKKSWGGFSPFRLVSDEEFCRNMNSIIAYYQIAKGDGKHRFTSSLEPKLAKIAIS
jgi:hypothetical protein